MQSLFNCSNPHLRQILSEAEKIANDGYEEESPDIKLARLNSVLLAQIIYFQTVSTLPITEEVVLQPLSTTSPISDEHLDNPSLILINKTEEEKRIIEKMSRERRGEKDPVFKGEKIKQELPTPVSIETTGDPHEKNIVYETEPQLIEGDLEKDPDKDKTLLVISPTEAQVLSE